MTNKPTSGDSHSAESKDAVKVGVIDRVISYIKPFKGLLLVIAGVGSILSGLSGYLTSYQTVKTSVSPKTASKKTLIPENALSIVVLPFATLGSAAEQAYFADGLTAKLTSDLSRINGVLVIASTTALTFKDKSPTAQQVGTELGVRYVLQGSVQRSGEKVRINALLADARSGIQLWADTFDGDQSDLFALQDQITARIANSIGREIVVAAVRESQTRKVEANAVDFLLRGIALSDKPNSLERLQQQENDFRQVLVLDPGNVDAMARLSRALVLQKIFFGSLLTSDIAEQKLKDGYSLALKAKDLEPNNARAELTIGLVSLSKGDFPEAVRAFQAGIALDRNNPLFYLSLANAYVLMAEHKKALPLAETAIQLDPLGQGRSGAMYHSGLANFYLGNNDLAIDWFLKARSANPNQPRGYSGLAVAYAAKGNEEKARESVGELLRIAPKFSLSKSAERPFPSSPDLYKRQYEQIYLPAARKSGLPD